MFEDPVCAGEGAVETGCCAVAGRVDAVFVEEVDHRDDAGHVDAGEVADAAAVVGWCGEVGEAVLGDAAFADGIVGVGIAGREDVDVCVGVVVAVAGAEGSSDG